MFKCQKRTKLHEFEKHELGWKIYSQIKKTHIKKFYNRSQKDSTIGKVLALYKNDCGLTSGTAYGPSNTANSDP